MYTRTQMGYSMFAQIPQNLNEMRLKSSFAETLHFYNCFTAAPDICNSIKSNKKHNNQPLLIR